MDFKPILRFAVMTDLHYSDKHLHVRDRFKSAAKSVYNYCVGEEYTALDALYIIGDFTDRGKKIDMQRLADDCDAYIKAVECMRIHLKSDSGKCNRSCCID